MLKFSTTAAWTEAVLADFNTFLLDHAACEKSLQHGDVDGFPLSRQA